jgi:hypothetical protein
MVYRNDIEALEARHRALEAELADRTRARDEVAHMLAEARARACDDLARFDLTMRSRAWRCRPCAAFAAVLAVLAMLGMAAESRRAKHEPNDRIVWALDQFSAFADQACACSDMECVRGVSDGLSRWGASMAREASWPAAPDDAMTRRAQQITQRLSACMTKAMASDASARRGEPQATAPQQ